VNLCVCLVLAITLLSFIGSGRWDWDSEAVLKQALKPIGESIVQFCRLNLRMCEGVDSKPAGLYDELATCHAQRSFLAMHEDSGILEPFVRPSVRMERERERAQNGLRFESVL
jgi:hypothetical protein